MATPLHVLIIEDNESDAVLTIRQMEKAGFEVLAERIETAEQMQAALSIQTWDVIIADYQLPEFNAPAALMLLQGTAADIPFIVVSGAIGEETAVALMRSGARDYLMKYDLARLAPVVKRELAEAGMRRERKQAENLLRLQSTALNAAANAIVITNLQGRIEWVNPAFTTLSGYTPEEAIGKNPGELVKSGQHDQAFYKILWDTILAGKVWHGEIVNRRKDGELYTEDLTITPLCSQDGQITQFIAIKQDITPRKQLENELREERSLLTRRVAERTAELHQMNMELVRANHTKDEFLANMSHELRTPLNGILTIAESLQEQTYGAVTERQKKALQIIEDSGQHLLGLINDILDLSKIETGKLEIYPEVIRASELCSASLAFVRQSARKKQIHLKYDNFAADVQLMADPRRLKQILVNLLSNAVKFTPEGGEVTLQVNPDPESQTIHFLVIDTGIGISSENQTRLFNPFTQIDSGLNRLHEGSGLGLALSKQLIELHAGSITVESQVDHGSSFKVTLPWQNMLRSGTNESSLQSQHTNLSSENIKYSGNILLAEDNETNGAALQEYFQHIGYAIRVAKNGLEAINLAREIQPDIIIMDIQMPIMDGLEATRRLRAEARFASVPIIALTALAMPGDRERCLEAGANEYLSKPIHMNELSKIIRKFLRQGDASSLHRPQQKK